MKKMKKLVITLISVFLLSCCSSVKNEAETEPKRIISIDQIKQEFLVNEMDIPFTPLIAKHCVDLDPFLVAAIIKTESNFNPYAVSTMGAVGLMQNIPGISTSYSALALRNPNIAVQEGCRYFTELKALFHTDEAALTAYNHGMGKAMNYVSWSTHYSRFVLKQRDYYEKDFRNYLFVFYGHPFTIVGTPKTIEILEERGTK